MRIRKLGLIIIFVFQVFLLSSCSTNKSPIWNNESSVVDTNKLYAVKTGAISASLDGVATLIPAKETSLYFNDVSGVLLNLNIKANDTVGAGQILGEISSDTINLQLSQANIDLKVANLQKSMNDLGLNNAKINISISKIELDRSEKLLNSAKVYQKDKVKIENENTLQDAQQEYEKALLLYQQNQNQLLSLQKNEEILNLDIQRCTLNIQDIKRTLDNCKLVAPTGGMITFVDNISLLDYISSNRVIAKIVEPKNYVLQLAAANKSGFDYGTKVQLKVNGQDFTGEVYKPLSGDLISTENASPKSNNLLYFTVDKPINNLKLGDKTTVSIVTKEHSGVIVIPRTAINVNGSKVTVNRYNNGKLETVEIEKGIESGLYVEILKGLKVDDRIVNSY